MITIIVICICYESVKLDTIGMRTDHIISSSVV